MKSSLRFLNVESYSVSMMLKTPDTNNGPRCIVMECGSGTMRSLGNGFDFTSITDIFISHAHKDHAEDTAPLIWKIVQSAEESNRDRYLYLWGPTITLDSIIGDAVRLIGKKVSKWRGIRLVRENAEYQRGITTFPVIHSTKSDCCGIMASLNGTRLLYPGDYGNQNDWREIAKCLPDTPTIAISEASEGMGQSTPFHSSCLCAQKFFEQCNVPPDGRVLWHIRRCSGVDKWAKDNNITIAKTGTTIEL